jgi:hypothetical protein
LKASFLKQITLKKCSFVNTVKQVYNNHPKTVAIVDWLIVKLKGRYCKKQNTPNKPNSKDHFE